MDEGRLRRLEGLCRKRQISDHDLRMIWLYELPEILESYREMQRQIADQAREE